MGGSPLTFTADPSERRRTLAAFLVGLAPQWLFIGRSARLIGVGLALLVAVLVLVEHNLRWCARSGPASGRSHRTIAALTPRPRVRRLLTLAAIVAVAALASSRYEIGSVVWV